MKRLKAALFCLSVVLLLYSWDPVHHGHCSEQKDLHLQNQPQTSSDVLNQQDESSENGANDQEVVQDHPAVNAVEQESGIDTTDAPETQETAQKDDIDTEFQADETPATADEPILDQIHESSITREDDADSQKPDVSSLPTPPVTESDSDSEDVSSTATVSPGPSTCSDDSCSSSLVGPVSPTAACEAGENPSYDSDMDSLPMVLENVSTHGTGKSSKPSLGGASKGTNVSSMVKEKIVPARPKTDPTLPPTVTDIPTFDEWKKIMMEKENEKSQTTHTSYNGGSSAVKKVQKTTNYASVECGAKILASNPEAKSTSAILMENVDVYMLNPCSNKIWFVIELCQPIQVKQLDIANFELFSSTPKDFLVSISDRYPTNKWAKLGTFHARDERTVQSFPLDEHLYAKYVKMFTKYMKVELLSHFGSEHFCPLSLLRVFGTSMMEEYELVSEPSERLTVPDEDDDYPPRYVPSDDKSSNNLIGSAKDAIINMVNNIAANVLGGNPEDGAQSGGNYSSLHLNSTETPGTPVQTVIPTSSKITMDSLEVDQDESTKVIETSSMTQDGDTGPTPPVPSPAVSETSAPLTPEPVQTTHTKEEQIVTLLPMDESDIQDQSTLQEAEKESVTDPRDSSGVKEKCREHDPDSCSSVISLKEFLLQRCFPVPLQHRKTTSIKSEKPHTQNNTLHKTEVSVPVMTSSSQTQVLPTRSTVETNAPAESSVPVAPEREHTPEAGSMDLAPSLTSVLVPLTSLETLSSRATQVVDFLDPLAVEHSESKLEDKSTFEPVEQKATPVLTSTLEATPFSKSEELDHILMSGPALEMSTNEKSTLTSSLIISATDQATSSSQSSSTDQSVVQETTTKSAPPAAPSVTAAVTDPVEVLSGVSEPKGDELVEDVPLEGQSVQPSPSDFYAEIPGSTETPIHGSNQKESVFMRLNNRIKALEVNMSLSGRYLEQLSQRYRKQMEEMQKAFNKTIIKLQNTSRMAEEQDQKQTESIQVLQKQLENVTRLVLSLSLHVSQLQREVSDRHSYLVLSVVLSVLICIVICVHYCRMSGENPSSEPGTSVPKSYSYCSPDRDSPENEDVNPKRRASYPLIHSAMQIATTEGPSEVHNVEPRRNSTGSKKKKRCKMKASTLPETITPTLLSSLSVPNGGVQCKQHSPHNVDLKIPPHSPVPPPFSFRDSPSEGSSEDSSQSDEPSFCGISSCNRLCDPLPAPKSRSKKRHRLKKNSSLLKQLLQPVECRGPPIASKFTLHGFITRSTELRANGPGAPLLPTKPSVD